MITQIRISTIIAAATIFAQPVYAEMLSDNYRLDAENIGVAGEWLSSSQYDLYSTIGLPPEVASDPSNSSSGFTWTATINASIAYMDPRFGEPVVIFLKSGWNLLGNGNDTPLDPLLLFSDATQVKTVWKWNSSNDRWSFYSSSLPGQALTDYAASKGYDVLTRINGGEGFWINVPNSFSLTLPAGTQILATDFKVGGKKQLGQGWNLVSIGETANPGAFNAALSSTPPNAGLIPINVTSMWAWDNEQGLWYFYTPKLEAEGTLQSYIANKGYLDFTSSGKTLGPGVGFWVNKP